MHFHFQISHSYWKQEGGLSPLMLCNPVTCLLENLKYKPEKKVLLAALCSGKQESRMCDLGEILQPSLT